MSNFNGIPYANSISIEKSNFMMEILYAKPLNQDEVTRVAKG